MAVVRVVRGEYVVVDALMQAITCRDCKWWSSKSGDAGWCYRGESLSGRCVDGQRELPPVTFKMDGCLYGARAAQDIAK